MILEITYKIRFPLGGLFSLDPRFLFIKKIYESIKKVLCLNETKKCMSCDKTDKCIYHMLSGKDFSEYPSILINRNFLEKRNYAKNEVLSLKFYLVGIASEYGAFITNFFDNTNTLEKNYFQNHLVSQEYYDETKTTSGTYNFITPLSSINDIYTMIDYYNQEYLTKIKFPQINNSSINKQLISDYNQYIINGKKIIYKGYKVNLDIQNLSYILIKTGIGKNNIIGGGKINEN